MGGTQINLSIGIDFTGSNGNIKEHDSLHYMDALGNFNQYQSAIRLCGDIISFYDFDQIFPVYGYGAILPGEQLVSHCFNLNLQDNPNIQSIDSVLEVYKQTLPLLKFSGPTYFSYIINTMISNIKDQNNKQIYNVLLILTDGLINDMNETVDSIVEASYLPLSIIVGFNDFENMDQLDGDKNPLLDRRGRKCQRDIVQFVAFNKHSNNVNRLAQEVLEEIPYQLVEYYRYMKIPPGDPITI
jgi:hypothetical protein